MTKLYKGHGYWTGGDIDLGSAGGCVNGESSDDYFIAADSKEDAIRALKSYLNNPDWKIRPQDVKTVNSGGLELKMLEKLDEEVEKVSELKWRWKQKNEEIERDRQKYLEQESVKDEIGYLEKRLWELKKRY